MTFDWQALILVGAIIVGLMFFLGRPKIAGKGDVPPDPIEDAAAGLPAELETGRLSGPELVDRIQEVLGVGILVESVELGEPVTIRATFMSGQHQTAATVTGTSEQEAWHELAKAAIAWRKSDYQHIPMWWGTGG